MSVLIQLTDTLGTLIDLFRVMGIVAEEDQFVGLDLEVEAPVYASKGLHAVFQFLLGTAIELGHRHSGNTILDIDGDGLSEFDVADVLNGRDEVKVDLSVADADILCMEIALVEAVVIASDTVLQILLHLKAAMDNQGTARLDEFCIMTETLQVSLFSAIDVEVVRVRRGDDAHPRVEPVERTVELIGLDDDVIGVGEDIVGAIVFGDASEEGITVEVALVHDMGAHGRRGGLTVGTCHAESLMGLCQRTEHLGALLDLKTVLTEELEFLVAIRNSRRIDDETRLLLLAGMGNLIDILLIMDEHTFLLQSAGELGGCLVVAAYHKTFLDEVTGDGTHADATGSDEINSFYILKFHWLD